MHTTENSLPQNHTMITLRRLSWRFLWKKHQFFYTLCLIISATLISCLGFFSVNVKHTLNDDIVHFLGAPLVISSRSQLPQNWWDQIDSTQHIKPPAITASFTYGATGNKGYRTIALKAVSKNYPLHNPLMTLTKDNIQHIHSNTQTLLLGHAWLDRRAMMDLGVHIGDTIHIGETSLIVAAEIIQEPDRLTQLQHLMPRVMIGLKDLQKMAIQSSTITGEYRYLFNDTTDELNNLEQQLPQLIQKKHSVIKASAGQHPFSRMAQRAENLLGFMMILIMLMCGSAAAILANKTIDQHLPSAAILRCMGINKNAFASVLLIQLSLLSIIASITGVVGGWMIQPLLAQTVAPHMIITQQQFAWSVPLMTVVIIIMIIYAFILPKLLGFAALSITKVLRGETALNKKTIITGISLIVTVFMMLWYFSDNARLTLYLFVAVITIIVVSMSIGWLINLLTSSFRHLTHGSLKILLRSLARNPKKHMAAMTTIAISVMAIIMINTLRGSFMQAYQVQRLTHDGHLMFSQLPSDQRQAFESFNKQKGLNIKSLYPAVTAQLIAINNQPLNQAITQQSDSREELRSPVRLSWSKTIPQNNTMLEGLWPESIKDGVSVEAEVMSDLGLEMGDTLTFNINGQQLESTITSRRSFKGGGSRFMFWFMFSPDALSNVTQQHMGGIELNIEDTSQKQNILRQLSAEFPQVLFVNLSDIVARTSAIMQAITTVMQVLLIMLICAATTVIIANAMITSDHKQLQLMKTLGVDQSRLSRMTMAQQGLIGFASSTVGVITAEIIAGVLFDQVFAIKYQAGFIQNVLIMGFTTLCFVIFGLFLSKHTQYKTTPVNIRA